MADNYELRNPEVNKKRETKDIIDSLWQKLPGMAKELIEKSQDMSVERNRPILKIRTIHLSTSRIGINGA